MEYRNITVVGTSHIAKQSLDEVAREIESKKPSIIAIELDRKRLHVLFNRKDNKISIYAISKVGLKGYIFALIGAWAEKKLGEHVGVMPGSEMKSAAEIAKKKGIRLALIDQDIEVTLSRLSKSLSWKEKRNFIADIFKGVVLRKKEVEFDLTTVPDKKLIKKLLGQVKKRYPNIYRVLVAERNQVMADNLDRK